MVAALAELSRPSDEARENFKLQVVKGVARPDTKALSRLEIALSSAVVGRWRMGRARRAGGSTKS